MNLRLKYSVLLSKLKEIPELNRARAEERFLLLKEYDDLFLPVEQELLGAKFRHKKAAIKYCQSKGVNLTTFYRYQRSYRRYGIEGLVPGYGYRLGDCSTRGKSAKKIILVKLNIEIHQPLSCLRELKDIIEAIHEIPEKQRAVSTKFLETVIGFSKRKFLKPLSILLTPEEIKELENYRDGAHKNQSIRAAAILMASRGHTLFEIALAVGHSPSTIYRWIRHFKERGTAFVKTELSKVKIEKTLHDRAARVIAILHTHPAEYGINRTSWTRETIRQAYRQTHNENLPICALLKIIKTANYSWRRARSVLISHDPGFKLKAQKVLDTLRGLGPSEAFFFIDEAGPWPVKKYGGASLTAKGDIKTYPQFQAPKGKVSFVAALDAVGNQVTWQFSKSKDTATVIDIIRTIHKSYSGCSTLYLTWDCASWHKSKKLQKFLKELNDEGSGPTVEVIPLPNSAQFLNVIEAIFSGMKRAVIHNSDYLSELEMQTAISKHFQARNDYFRENPKRAGDKIWDKERFNLEDFESGLHRHM